LHTFGFGTFANAPSGSESFSGSVKLAWSDPSDDLASENIPSDRCRECLGGRSGVGSGMGLRGTAADWVADDERELLRLSDPMEEAETADRPGD
jgi:hypothetical protein